MKKLKWVQKWVQNKEESPGTLEIPGLSLAEKERFELEDFHEIGHNETQRDAIEHNILGAFHNGNQPDTIPVWV